VCDKQIFFLLPTCHLRLAVKYYIKERTVNL
jgi:hypothetical protein